MDKTVEKRKRVALNHEEIDVLRWLYVKTLIPIILIVVVSSVVLYYGIRFLMPEVGFANLALAPGAVRADVSRFIGTYFLIAAVNLLLMIILSTIIMYTVIHNLVMPILRITRELKRMSESGVKSAVTVRKTDRLLVPLVDAVNRLM